ARPDRDRRARAAHAGGIDVVIDQGDPGQRHVAGGRADVGTLDTYAGGQRRGRGGLGHRHRGRLGDRDRQRVGVAGLVGRGGHVVDQVAAAVLLRAVLVPLAPLFPYTTLFRSARPDRDRRARAAHAGGIDVVIDQGDPGQRHV